MIVLDLPAAPVSVNRSRRIDWANYKHVKAWLRQADALFLTQKRELMPLAITGRYELAVVLPHGSQTDLDNVLKLLVDTVRRFRLVTNDSPKFMRRLIVEFGDVEGCRVTIKPMEG